MYRAMRKNSCTNLRFYLAIYLLPLLLLSSFTSEARADHEGAVATAVATTEKIESTPTILGMTYTQAALVSAAVVGSALVVNSLVGANLGTTLAVLYVGHLIVEAGIVAIAAGGSLGLGWWADDRVGEEELF
jgi:hypothetical protein